MDQSSRQSEILSLLEMEGACSIIDLAERFSVSDETVRRDVRQLEARGYVHKTHGGVRLPDNIFEAPYRQRQTEQADAKQRIGALAADLVQDGTTIFIDGSTTAFWVARNLTCQRNVSIVTNGIEVARELYGRNNNRVYLAGGQLSDNYLSTFGPAAIDFVSKFTIKLAFIGVSAIHSEHGYCDAYLPEADLIRAVLPRAEQRVIVADATKFGLSGLTQIARFEDIDTLVTDKVPPKEFQDKAADIRIAP